MFLIATVVPQLIYLSLTLLGLMYNWMKYLSVGTEKTGVEFVSSLVASSFILWLLWMGEFFNDILTKLFG